MNIPKSFMYLGKGYLGPIPIPIILMIVIYGAGIYVMRSSKLVVDTVPDPVPGPGEAMKRTGFDGQDCAEAALLAATRSSARH